MRYKLVTTERIRNYLVPEPNYHIEKFLTENFLGIDMTKTEILMNKQICLVMAFNTKIK